MHPKDRAGPPRVDDWTRCPFIPGGPECGASPQKRVVGCDGSFETCRRYGNQENFGGTPPFISEPVGAPWDATPRDAEKADPIEDVKRAKAYQDLDRHRMAILPVQAYEVGGEIYKDRDEAERVATERAFLEWYESGADTVLYGRYEGSRIDAGPMLEWIREHRYVLAKLLKTMV